jgi:hypothetical protein
MFTTEVEAGDDRAWDWSVFAVVAPIRGTGLEFVGEVVVCSPCFCAWDTAEGELGVLSSRRQRITRGKEQKRRGRGNRPAVRLCQRLCTRSHLLQSTLIHYRQANVAPTVANRYLHRRTCHYEEVVLVDKEVVPWLGQRTTDR